MFSFTGTTYDGKEKIWNGPKRKDLYNFDLTVGEAVLMELQKNPQKIIQISDTTGETLTAQELVNNASILAKNLIKLDIKPKDIIGLYAQNTTHVVTVMLASFLCGAPVNALFPGFDRDNVSIIYKLTKPKIVFCDIENYDNAKKCNEDLNLNALIFLMNGEITGVSNIKDLLTCDDADENDLQTFKFPCSDLSGEDTVVILCSSGTTGTPKGVTCSHHSLLNKMLYFTLKSDSVLFSFSAMYWATALLTLVASILNGVLRIITDRPFTPEYLLYLVENYKISHLMCNTAQIAELVLNVDAEKIRKSLKSIDTLMCGGAKIPQVVQEKMLQILSDNTKRPGFANAYGMTELLSSLSFNGGYPCEFLQLSEGKLTMNAKVRIIDRDGNYLGPNERGELLVSTPYTWLGYYHDTETTQKALINNWLHTGDIGYFNDDGFLHLCGRDKDNFKSSHFQIYPQIIEDIVLRIPGVAEACVIGIPDLVATNLTACVIVRAQDKNGTELTSDAIDQHIKNNMASMYHLKGGVYFVASIPKTASGKVLRRKILELVHQI